jgi:hypothetical protein
MMRAWMNVMNGFISEMRAWMNVMNGFISDDARVDERDEWLHQR